MTRSTLPTRRISRTARAIVGAATVLTAAAAAVVPAMGANVEPATGSPEGFGVSAASVDTASTTRATMVARAQSWVDAKVPYDQEAYRDGHRTDCSGYVSMIWGLSSSLTTQSLTSVSHPITKRELKTGDVLLYKNPSGGQGHVAMFDKWVDASRAEYWAYEEYSTGPGSRIPTAHRKHPYPYSAGHGTYLPYRYNNVNEVSTSSDVTGDGVDDILGMKKGKLYLHRGNGNGEFKTHQIRGNRGYNRDWLGAADMQGKGTLSVLGRTNGRLYRYYNNGKSDFRASAPLRKRGYNYTKLFTGHFNADTYTDLFGMKNGKLYVFINNKKGDFKARKLLGNRGYNHTWLGTTDMNSDGHDDILGITRGKLHLYTYNTKTRDYRSSKLLDNNRYTADNLLTADINYDGKADIIRETKGKLYAHNNTGKEFRKARLIESSGFNYTQLLS